MKKKDDTPIERQVFRYWVELRDLRDGTVRELPVSFVQRILLTTKRKGKDKAGGKTDAQEAPPEIRVRVQDADRIWDARDRDDLARQLREAYPDGAFERTMKCERDLVAEERHWSAMEELMRVIARAAVRKALAADATELKSAQ
jgi:hypothetical protein